MAKPQEYAALMHKATKRIAAMDRVDGSAVTASSLDMTLRTVMLALRCAISTGEWSIVAEAQVMLQQLQLRYRPADLKASGPYLAK